MNQHAADVENGRRFEFGKNWRAFLSVLDEERIIEAEKSLKRDLKVDDLKGCTFLDIGSGSGLFSLAARRLGARVHSFDYDPQSVACTRELGARYFPDDPDWRIEQASVLDQQFLSGMPRYDVVYSWGVLHHTGDMWRALANAAERVADHGSLFIAIYNYQVYWTSFYTAMKRAYNRAPNFGKYAIAGTYIAVQVVKGLIKDLLLLRNPLARYQAKKTDRGMSMWYDWIDWVGGYPFETAKPEQIFDFFHQRGFRLEMLRTAGGGHGCNEFIFRRGPDS